VTRSNLPTCSRSSLLDHVTTPNIIVVILHSQGDLLPTSARPVGGNKLDVKDVLEFIAGIKVDRIKIIVFVKDNTSVRNSPCNVY
jgi:hypothetical protein